MRILANENVYDPIIQFLRDEGHEVISIRESGMSGMFDDEIYDKAVREGLTILTMGKVSPA